MAYATTTDVSNRLGRQLSDSELTQATALLEDVEAVLRSRIPNLDARVADPDFEQKVVAVESSAVARVLRNPGGVRQETEGNYSVTTDTRAASGFLAILEDEWRWLGARRRAFVITPTLPTPCSEETE